MKEIWKDVVGYEGLYRVSTEGRVMALPRKTRCRSGGFRTTSKRILKQAKNNFGYCLVNLHKGPKQRSEKVHRLVGLAFIPNPCNYKEINHKDENPSNNSIDNLEWCDHLYNSRYGNRGAKLSAANTNNPIVSLKVIQYSRKGEKLQEFPSINEASRKTGVHCGSICWACMGKLLSAGGYIWKYKK